MHSTNSGADAIRGFPGGSVGQESTFDALDVGDMGSIHGSVRSLGGGPGYPPPQENLMDEEPGRLQSIGSQIVGH